MKRLIAVFITISLIASNGAIAFSDDIREANLSPKKIMVYLKPDLTVEYNGIRQIFFDSEGKIVYPLLYNGSAYLPVRATSKMIGEPIEWDSASKTVFIGKTLSNPNKTTSHIITDSAIEYHSIINKSIMKAEIVSAYLKPDIIVMYDFVPQIFFDINENRVYPIIYNGTTYLPIRAVSKLIKQPIEWKGEIQTISIGNREERKEGQEQEQENNEGQTTVSTVSKKLKMIFEQEEVLYYEATAKTTKINGTTSLNEKQLIADTISEDYLRAQKITADIKIIDTSEFNDKEKVAYKKLIEFAESTEHYILILENIGYLAAQNADYSMLADTFLYFAIDSQAKMEDARKLIQELNEPKT